MNERPELITILSELGVAINLAKQFVDDPETFRNWITSPHYRSIATSLFPKAQLVNAPEDQKKTMTEINSAIAALKKFSKNEFATDLELIVSSPTPYFAQIRRLDEDLKASEAEIKKLTREKDQLKARSKRNR